MAMITRDMRVFGAEGIGSVRASLGDDGQVWFVASDVCRSLGLGNVTAALRRLDLDEFSRGKVVDSIGRAQLGLIVSEAGMYRLVLASRKPCAAAYRRWIVHEVLPAIRRDGGYMAAAPSETEEQTLARALLIAERSLERERERVAALLEHERALVPKAQYYDNLMSADGLLSVRDAAKVLKSCEPSMGAARLLDLLRADRMVERRTRRATALAIERSYMRERTFAIRRRDGREEIDHYGCLTTKGLRWCLGRYCFVDKDKEKGRPEIERLAGTLRAADFGGERHG